MKDELGFSDTAVWMGYPLEKMTREDVIRALAYKTHELRLCYLNMHRDQTKKVETAMSEYPIPVPSAFQ